MLTSLKDGRALKIQTQSSISDNAGRVARTLEAEDLAVALAWPCSDVPRKSTPAWYNSSQHEYESRQQSLAGWPHGAWPSSGSWSLIGTCACPRRHFGASRDEGARIERPGGESVARATSDATQPAGPTVALLSKQRHVANPECLDQLTGTSAVW